MYWKISKNDKRVQKLEHYFREQEEDLTRTAANKQEKFKVWSNLNRTANKPTFLSEQPQKKFLKLNPVAPKQVPAKIVLKRSFQFQLFLGDKKKHLLQKITFCIILIYYKFLQQNCTGRSTVGTIRKVLTRKVLMRKVLLLQNPKSPLYIRPTLT